MQICSESLVLYGDETPVSAETEDEVIIKNGALLYGEELKLATSGMRLKVY